MKICNNCNNSIHVASKKCKFCEAIIKPRGKSLEEHIPKCKTNLTVQKNIVHGRLLGLQRWHGYNAIVLYAKRGDKGSYLFDSFTTPGFAREYFGETGDLSKSGCAIMSAVETCFKGYCANMNNVKQGASGDVGGDVVDGVNDESGGVVRDVVNKVNDVRVILLLNLMFFLHFC